MMTYKQFLEDPRSARADYLAEKDDLTGAEREEFLALSPFIVDRSAAFFQENPDQALANAKALLAQLESI